MTSLHAFSFFAGISISLASLYLAEIAPKMIRGAVGTVHQLFITLGLFWGAVMGLPEMAGIEYEINYFYQNSMRQTINMISHKVVLFLKVKSFYLRVLLPFMASSVKNYHNYVLT